MTSLAERPVPASVGAGRWRYDVDDLAIAGVTLRDDQHDLLVTRAKDELVLVALPLPAPEALLMGGRMSETVPLEVRSDQRSAPQRPTAPFLAEVAWEAAEELEETVGPIWRRFPSLPVRVVYPDVDFWPLDANWEEARYTRIWNVTVPDSAVCNDALAFAHELAHSWNPYIKLGMFWAVLFNQLSECELAVEYEGIPPEYHQHYQVPSSVKLFDIKCGDGEQICARLERELFTAGFRGGDVRPFELPTMDIDLAVVWAELSGFARAASRQAMQVAPGKAGALLYDEWKGGCPWEL